MSIVTRLFNRSANAMHQADVLLVKALLKGDEAAFARFYQTYFNKMYRFCRGRVNNEANCHDIVQQSLTNAMRYLHTYRGEASLLTWLFQITRNEIAQWHKQFGKNDALTSTLDDNPALLAAIESVPSTLDGSSPDLSDGLKLLVRTTLDTLPTAYGDLLEMKYIEGLSVQEIALQLCTGETAVQSQLARARKAFKTLFNDLKVEWNDA